MRRLLGGMCFGLLVGIVVGWIMSERWEEWRFANDPDIQAHKSWREGMIAMEKLINDA